MRTSRPSQSPSYGSLVDAVATEFRSRFGLIDCWYEPFPFDRQLPRIEPGRIVLPGAEPGIDSWNIGTGIELPVRWGNLPLGRFVLVPASPTTVVGLSPTDRTHATAIATEVAPTIAAALAVDEAGRDHS